jgi:hypothetical protein
MPVKIFAASADGAAALETKINEWMAKLEPGVVRLVSTAAGPAGALQIVVTIWYTEARDKN